MAIQIAVQPPGQVQTASDAAVEAAIRRVAMILYLRSHCEVPATATDFGGGVFNVLV